MSETPVAQPAPASPLAMLRQTNFRRFWVGQAISLIGDNFYMIALPLLALQLGDGSGVALGTVFMLMAIPRALLMLFGGAISDRTSPRRVMMLTNWCNALTIGVLALLLATDSARLWHLYLVSVLLGTVDAFYFPAAGSMMPLIIDAQDLQAGNSMYQLTLRLLLLVGPALAGIVIAAVGIPAALLVDVVTFGIANIFLFLIQERKRKKSSVPAGDDTDSEAAPAQKSILGSIKEGLNYVFKDPVLPGVLLIVAAIDVAAAGPISVGLPALAELRFEQGAAALGFMLSGFGGGSFAGVLLAGFIRTKRLGYLILGLSLMFSIGFASIAFASSPIWVMLALAFIGLGGGIFNVIAISWLQRRTDDALIGRVMSLVSLSSAGLAPLSHGIAGVAIEWRIDAVFIGAGLLILLVTIGLALRPSFRQITID